MECRINRERIKDAIQSKIINILTESGFSYYEGVLAPTEQDISVVDYVNSIFQENVVNQDFEINISEELVDAYMSKYQNIVSNQEEDLFSNPTKVSVTTPAMVRVNRFLDQAGVQVESLENISMNGQNLGVEGIALPLQALIQHVSTTEDSVLTEEAMHIAVELISQKDKGLFDSMMSKITSYPIYGETFRQYKDLESYQTNGKPNITKIKKEAIGKLLTQAIVNNEEIQEPKSWWAKVKSYLKSLFSPLKQEINDFNQAISTIFDGDLGTIRDTLLQSKEYLVENGFDSEQADRVINLAQSDITDYELRIAMGNMQVDLAYYKVMPSTERLYSRIKTKSETITRNSDGTYTVAGKNLRTSDFLEAEKALSKKLTKSSPDYSEILNRIQNNDRSAEFDIAMDVLSKYLNSDGTASTIPVDSITNNKDEKYRQVAEKVLGIVGDFEQGTVFLPNVKVSDDQAGATVDLIVIDNNQVVHLFNFQSTKDTIDNEEQVALKAKLETARTIIAKDYGNTKFGETRIVPIQKNIVKDVSDAFDYLRVIPTDSESLGSRVLDSAFQNLYSIRGKKSGYRLRTLEELRLNKTINSLIQAYKSLQVSQYVKPIENQIRELKELTDDINSEFVSKVKNKKFVDYSSKEMQSLLSRMATVYNLGESMLRTSEGLIEFNRNRTKKVNTKGVSGREAELRVSYKELENSLTEFMEGYANSEFGIQGLASPEMIQKWAGKMFNTTSQQNQTNVKVFSRIIQKAQGTAELRHSETLRKMGQLKPKIEEWAKRKGIKTSDTRKLMSFITEQSEDGKYMHRLISKIDNSFHEQATEALKRRDIEWVKKNIDLEAYNQHFEEERDREFSNYEVTVRSYNEEITDEELIELRKQEWLDLRDLSRGLNPENTWVHNFAKESLHLSKRYRELTKKDNEPMLELYNMWESLNNKASELGVLDRKVAKTFLPEIGRTNLDKLINGKGDPLDKTYKEVMNVHKDYVSYGEFVPLQSKDRVVPFTLIYSVAKKKIDPNTGEIVSDYSNVVTDPFTLMSAYSMQIELYDTYSNAEDAAYSLEAIERNKKSLSTKTDEGRVTDVPQEIDNVENYENLQKHIVANLYGHKYDDDLTGTISIDINKTTKFINNKFGANLREDYPVQKLKIKNTLDSMRGYFIAKALGWNIASAITNTIGTRLQAKISAGTWFTKKEIEINSLKLFQDKLFKMTSREKGIKVGLLDMFIPVVDNENNVEEAGKLSFNKASSFDFSRLPFQLLRNSDKLIQWVIGTSFLENTIVQDGKLVNIREYLKGQEKYINIYNGTFEQQRSLEAEFEREVTELKKRNLEKIAFVNADGFVEIPGIPRVSDTVVEIRRMIQQLSKDASGTGTVNEYRRINANFFVRNALTFFSWAPRLTQKRFGGIRRTEGSLNVMEQGRAVTFVNALNKWVTESGTSFIDLLKLSERGVESLKEEFQKVADSYEKRTGQPFYSREGDEDLNRRIAERDFIQMYQKNLKDGLVELRMLMTAWVILFSIVKLAPDDDEEVKGIHKFAAKLGRKALGELLFYYNPASLMDITNGKVVPAINVVNDAVRLSNAFRKELFGTEEEQEKTQTLGKLFKTIPVFSQVAPVLSMFSQDLAKELDYEAPKVDMDDPQYNN